MSLIEKPIDIAPARTVGPLRLASFVRPIANVLRAFRNRREIAVLASFDDQLLADIGLTRADVRSALSTHRLDDPSGHLTEAARHRRPGQRRP